MDLNKQNEQFLLLSSEKLTKVPSELFNKAITNLFLDNNLLSSIPPELGNLTSLQSMAVFSYELKELD